MESCRRLLPCQNLGIATRGCRNRQAGMQKVWVGRGGGLLVGLLSTGLARVTAVMSVRERIFDKDIV